MTMYTRPLLLRKASMSWTTLWCCEAFSNLISLIAKRMTCKAVTCYGK